MSKELISELNLMFRAYDKDPLSKDKEMFKSYIDFLIDESHNDIIKSIRYLVKNNSSQYMPRVSDILSIANKNKLSIEDKKEIEFQKFIDRFKKQYTGFVSDDDVALVLKKIGRDLRFETPKEFSFTLKEIRKIWEFYIFDKKDDSIKFLEKRKNRPMLPGLGRF